MQLFWHHVLKTCLLFYGSNNFVVSHIVKYVGIFCRLYFFLPCFISSWTNTTILKFNVVVVLPTQLCLTLWSQGLESIRLLCPWNSQSKNTGVGCHSLLWGISLTQGSNPVLPLFRQILDCLSHQGKPQTNYNS